jgi:hypothetical protein
MIQKPGRFKERSDGTGIERDEAHCGGNANAGSALRA